MQPNKHTKGPWARFDNADYAEIHPASGKDGSAIALVANGPDADLIAAGPDMLDALIDVATFAHQFHGKMESVHGDEALAALSETVDAAILKALGGAA